MLDAKYMVTHWRIKTLGRGLLGVEATSNWQEPFPVMMEMLEKMMRQARKFGGVSECAMRWEKRFPQDTACSVKTVISFNDDRGLCDFLTTLVT